MASSDNDYPDGQFTKEPEPDPSDNDYPGGQITKEPEPDSSDNDYPGGKITKEPVGVTPPHMTRREFTMKLKLGLDIAAGIPRELELPFPDFPFLKLRPIVTRSFGTDPHPPDPMHRWPRIFLPDPPPSITAAVHPGRYRMITPSGPWPPEEPRERPDPCPSLIDTTASTASIDIPVAHKEISLLVSSTTKPILLLSHVNTGQPVTAFIDELSHLTDIPSNRLKLLVGFPPKRVVVDRSLTVESFGFKSRESIFVEMGSPLKDACTGTGICPEYGCVKYCGEKRRKGCNKVVKPDGRHVPFYKDESTNTGKPIQEGDKKGPIWTVGTQTTEESIASDTLSPPTPEISMEDLPTYPTNWDEPTLTISQDKILRSSGILLKKSVPSDNSCLFSSIRYALTGLLGNPDGYLIPESSKYLRDIVAGLIESDPERYNEAFLGRPNAEYTAWISRLDSWGGGIEIAILAEYYQVEIAVVSSQAITITVFGQGQKFPKRIYLLYNGVHYDPLFMELYHSALVVRSFRPDDMDPYDQAIEMAQEMKASDLFTDVKKFPFRCDKCKSHFNGLEAATTHAKVTGHTDFHEITQIER